ncbi:MAG: hypothetical protein IT214_10985 [Chitinophagaceae bacterium]|nr:hypothetical protein [Chitinophagaceae bacterium]
MKWKSPVWLMIIMATIVSAFVLFFPTGDPQNNSGHKEATEADGKCRKPGKDPMQFDMIWENLTRQLIS